MRGGRRRGASDDAVAATDGERERLLAEGVQPAVEKAHGDAVARGGIGGAARRLQPLRLGRHPRRIGDDRRPAPGEVMRLVGEVRRVPLVQVVDGDEVDRAVAGPRQLGEPRRMPPPHAPATDDGQPHRLHAVPPALLHTEDRFVTRLSTIFGHGGPRAAGHRRDPRRRAFVPPGRSAPWHGCYTFGWFGNGSPLPS